MLIEKFTLQDIPSAAELTYAAWGKELAGEAAGFSKFVYESMVRYYCRQDAYSYKLTEQDGMAGFLLAARPEKDDVSNGWFARHMQGFDQRQQLLSRQYLAYLRYNGLQLKQQAKDEDLLLLLFLSKLKGGGSALLENVEEQAASAGLNALHLWADETCDYEYYRRRGFTITQCFTNKVLPQLGEQKTYIYSKKLEKSEANPQVRTKAHLWVLCYNNTNKFIGDDSFG